MKFNVERCTTIINDLIYYCHHLGSTAYHINFYPSKPKSSFTFKADIKGLTEEMVAEIKESLSYPRQHEIEESYWGITYDCDTPCELTMIGMMLDETTVKYDGEVLTIMAERND